MIYTFKFYDVESDKIITNTFIANDSLGAKLMANDYKRQISYDYWELIKAEQFEFDELNEIKEIAWRISKNIVVGRNQFENLWNRECQTNEYLKSKTK